MIAAARAEPEADPTSMAALESVRRPVCYDPGNTNDVDRLRECDGASSRRRAGLLEGI